MPRLPQRVTIFLLAGALACSKPSTSQPQSSGDDAGARAAAKALSTGTKEKPTVHATDTAAPVEVPGGDELASKPVLVLLERNPWAMVLGAEIPTFVMYQDGLVIFQQKEGDRLRAYTARLDATETRTLVEGITTPAFVATADRTSVVGATDQPTVEIFASTAHGWIGKSVYGIDRTGKPSIPVQRVVDSTGKPTPSQPWKHPPEAFVSAYQRMLHFDHSGKKEWHPDTIELMLWDFSHAKKPGYTWPTDLPPLPADLEPPAQGTRKVTLPGNLEGRVRQLLAEKGGLEPLLLNGHKWSVSMRRQVPGDSYVQAVRRAVWKAHVPGH